MNVATNSDLGRIGVMANDDPPALVPERVRRLRQGLGLSQAGLAEVSGVSQSTISRIEKGTPHKVSGENERALAKALGTTVDYLMGRTVEQGTHQPAPRAWSPRGSRRGRPRRRDAARAHPRNRLRPHAPEALHGTVVEGPWEREMAQAVLRTGRPQRDLFGGTARPITVAGRAGVVILPGG